MALVLATVRARVGRLLTRRQLEPDDDRSPADPLTEPSPILAGLAGASVQGRVALGPRAGARVRRFGDEPDLAHAPSRGPRQAQLDGFDLHANVWVPPTDRAHLEHLCRYRFRPPLAQHRLQLRGDRRVLLALKRAWRDGTSHLLFEPIARLETLAALIARPAITLALSRFSASTSAPRRATASAICCACCVFGQGGITPSAFARCSATLASTRWRWGPPAIVRWRSCVAASPARPSPSSHAAHRPRLLDRCEEPSSIDSEAHRAPLVVEEAGVDGNNGRVGCGDLLDGAPRRRAAGRNEAEVRFVKSDLEGMAREGLGAFPAHLEGRVRDAGGHDRKPQRRPAGRVGGGAAHREDCWQDPEKETDGASQIAHLPGLEPSTPSTMGARQMTLKTVFGLVGCIGVAIAGCATVAGHLPSPQAARASGHFLAGVARVDITPVPGVPMGGHSKVGKTSIGYWTRLFARAFVLEDASGHSVVLVSCDLWSVPAGLVDRVAEILLAREETHHIDRDQLILAATHTHHSPGNFSTSAFYNTFASPLVGFDAQLFEFLAQRIGQSITEAVRSRHPATVSYIVSPLHGLARNRSLPAFLLNRDRAEIGDHGVDRRLAALWIRDAASPERVLGVAAFAAMHPTVLGPATPLYSADLFGAAANYAERILHLESPGAVVAIFNGAGGDVSVASQHGGLNAARQLGVRLGHTIVANPGRERVDGVIRHRVARQRLAGQCVEGGAACTADFPLYGAGALGGSERNHWLLSWLGWREGATGSGIPGHGAKRAALGPFGRLLMPSSALPVEAPLGVYQVGGLLFVTLPGEFTTAMGRRVAAGVAAAADWPPERVVLVGLANEYLSYFATPEEYSLQHYEGASTLWGPPAGPLLGRGLAQLAATLPTAPRGRAPTDFHYRAGLARTFTFAGAGSLADSPHAGLGSLLRDAEDGRRLAELPTFCWGDAMPAMSASARVTPRVMIVKATAPGTFAPLFLEGIAEDDGGVNFVTVAGLASSSSGTAEPRSEWCATWLGASATGPLHFQVQTLRGPTLTSPPITPFELSPSLRARGRNSRVGPLR